jgi:ring-1,2-phenylacetyl-CoA epoxidase subunit PaaA
MRYEEETGHWLPGPIDWDEFRRVIQGNGPCNHERIQARRRAHEDGRWVREALTAYASRTRDA